MMKSYGSLKEAININVANERFNALNLRNEYGIEPSEGRTFPVSCFAYLRRVCCFNYALTIGFLFATVVGLLSVREKIMQSAGTIDNAVIGFTTLAPSAGITPVPSVFASIAPPSYWPEKMPSLAPTELGSVPLESLSLAPTDSFSDELLLAPTESFGSRPIESLSPVPSESFSHGPSLAPTESLGSGPIESLSPVPTDSFSHGPSLAPTESLGSGPIKSLSSAPTESFNHGPSLAPTESLGSGPIKSLSSAPTESFSDEPSLAPAEFGSVPLESLSLGPTDSFSVEPSLAPTESFGSGPIESLSSVPTDSFSHGPSLAPTESLGSGPIKSLNSIPTEPFSDEPSLAPTESLSSTTESFSSAPTEPPTNIVMSTAFQISVSNDYSGNDNIMFAYPFLQDALLMEPHRENLLSLSYRNEDCSYDWNMTGIADQTLMYSWTGTVNSNSFIVTPLKTGEYELTVFENCPRSQVYALNRSVWVKYVRRELQSLTPSDREEFLDALHTLWEVSTEDGKVLYGDDYKSLYYLATIHNDGGANSICDQFHANTGFLNNHVLLGSFLQQSLQLVNPRVALHYMEYTKYFSSEDFDTHLENQLDGRNWTELLSSAYFGSNDPISGEILDGRWAHSSVPYMDEEFFAREGIDTEKTFFPEEESRWLQISNAHMTSPYGLLRAPWNYNPSNFTLRYNNVNRISTQSASKHVFKPFMGSTCDDYETFIKSNVVGQPLQTYLTLCEAQVHGKIHFTFGGAGGDHCYSSDESLKSLYGFTDSDLVVLTSAAQTFFKTYIPMVDNSTDFVSPLNCSAIPWKDDALTSTVWPAEPGGPTCECSDYYFQSEDTLADLIGIMFKDYVDDPDTPAIDTLYGLSFEDRQQAVQLICSRMQFDGDMAGSGAATDPLFWVAHGAVERLFQRVMFEDVLTDKTYKSIRHSTCSGHAADGTKKWLEGFYLAGSAVDATTITNEQFVTILDPTSDEYRDYLNFVYEDSGWSWCEGFDSWFN